MRRFKHKYIGNRIVMPIIFTISGLRPLSVRRVARGVAIYSSGQTEEPDKFVSLYANRNNFTLLERFVFAIACTATKIWFFYLLFFAFLYIVFLTLYNIF